MNILMMTNTYLPHVGGVARSIERFATRYREIGHSVKVVAPTFDGMPAREVDVIRIPAMRNFNHTDFSAMLPVPHPLKAVIEDWKPDIIHSHHPFLVGGVALRVAHSHRLPLVFTHHTRYEDYTHNVPGDSALVKRFVIRLATRYANHCDRVFAPSESIAALIRGRGVKTPVSVVPTGVVPEDFAGGDAHAMRGELRLPSDAVVVGHLGRLSQEKNIGFLANALVKLLQKHPQDTRICCVVFGKGSAVAGLRARFREAGFEKRLYCRGVVGKERLADAYAVMDVFVFSSLSETQGMVLTEAMAAGVPVVALDAPGVREVVEDRVNGRLLMAKDSDAFADAVAWVLSRDAAQYQRLACEARRSAARFSMHVCADKALRQYARMHIYDAAHRSPDYPAWVDALHVLQSEWMILENTLRAASEGLHG